MFLDKGMIEVAVVPHQIFVGFEFLGLLIGGHLTRAQRDGTVNDIELKNSGTICVTQMHQVGFSPASPHSSSQERRRKHDDIWVAAGRMICRIRVRHAVSRCLLTRPRQ
jgi:hypothetical protein